MKQIQHRNNGVDFLFQEVPESKYSEGAPYVEMSEGKPCLFQDYSIKKGGLSDEGVWWEELPAGEWEIVGPASSLTEEQASSLCPPLSDAHPEWEGFFNYNHMDEFAIAYPCDTATESLQSLLSSLSLDYNRTIVLRKLS